MGCWLPKVKSGEGASLGFFRYHGSHNTLAEPGKSQHYSPLFNEISCTVTHGPHSQ